MPMAPTHFLWPDRRAAGQALALRLLDLEGAGASTTLVALPRGGVPVAAAMAERLHLPLVTWAVRKLAEPWAPEVAIGAVAPGGVVLWAPEAVDLRQRTDPSLREALAREQGEELERRRLRFGDPPAASLAGRHLIVVDDGIATGMTTLAALRSLRLTGPASLTLAVPVAERSLLPVLGRLVERLEVLRAVLQLRCVGEWYERFDQVDDDEVLRLLAQARRWAPG
jgi:putative phosphoribosyl transferase